MTNGLLTRAARLATVLGLIGGSVLLASAPAHAGGPTSVLLVSPATGQTASLYYSDADYDRLSTALGGYQPAADPTIADDPVLNVPTSPGSASVTVTWMIHDVSVWRIDRIFFTGDAGPLIVTQTSEDGGDLSAGMYPGETGNETAVWHRAPDPAELRSLLTTLQLLGPTQPELVVDNAVATPAAAGDQSSVTTDPLAAASSVDPADRAGVTWWWLLGGLVAGIALTALAVRFVPAIRRQVISESAGDEPTRMVEVAR